MKTIIKLLEAEGDITMITSQHLLEYWNFTALKFESLHYTSDLICKQTYTLVDTPTAFKHCDDLSTFRRELTPPPFSPEYKISHLDIQRSLNSLTAMLEEHISTVAIFMDKDNPVLISIEAMEKWLHNRENK